MQTVEMVLTNNFYVWARSILFSSGQANNTVQTNGVGLQTSVKSLGELVGKDGVSYEGFYSQNSQNRFASLFSFTNDNSAGSIGSDGYTYFTVGSGTTLLPSVENYALESPISTVSITLSASKDDTGLLTFFLVVRNTGSSDIYVSEIGLEKGMTQSGGSFLPLLFGRCMFNPVLISAGHTESFTVTISLPIPA